MIPPATTARILAEAMPYIRAWHGKVVVVRFGGAAMTDPALKAAFARDVALLQLVGMKPVVVHGGGWRVDELMLQMGVEPRRVRGRRVTDAVFEAGYGSLSRFYEKAAAGLGMAAKAYRAKGKGQSIAYTTFHSPLGCILLASTGRGLCSVKIGDTPEALVKTLAAEFSEADLRQDGKALKTEKDQVLAFLSGDATLAKLPLDVRGTVFQQRVWSALRQIPRGETRTYKDIASAIGSPKAVRAVGSACGANPVALVIPCHRALRTDGGLGGYAWGLERKQKLLKIERKRPGD